MGIVTDRDGTKGTAPDHRAPGASPLLSWASALLVALVMALLAAPLAPGRAVAGTVVVAVKDTHDATPPDQSLGRALDLLEDPDGSLRAEDLMAGPAAARFTPSTRDAPGFPRTTSTYWARVTLDNPGPGAVDRLLVFSYPYYHALDLYMETPDGGWEERHVREGTQARGTDVAHRYPIFALKLQPGQTRVLIRVNHYHVAFPVALRSEKAQALIDRRDSLLHGITFGIVFIGAAYQLALVLMARMDSGLTLLAYAGVTLAYIYGQLGYPWEHLPAEWASHYYRLVPGSLPVAAGQAFAMQFLDMRRDQPRLYRVLWVLTALLLLDTPLLMGDPARGAGPAQILTLVGSLLVLGSGVWLARRSVNARFFLLGFVPIIGVAVVWSLRSAGVLAASGWTEGVLYAFNALGLVLLTFGVAYRIGRERRQRELDLAASEQALRRANDQLEARVAARTVELSDSLDKLKTSQDALVRAEKMASLGQLVAGVAHEINTPIGVALTTASHLAERAGALDQLVSGGGLRRSDLSDFLGDLRESASLLVANVSRAATLVQSFKQVSADQSSEEGRRVELGAYLREVLASLSPSLRRHGHETLVRCPRPVEIATYPGLLAQVVTNFVTNSLTHAYEPGQHGRITLTVTPAPGGAEIVYADDGRGIPADILPRVFDPFFTTRRGTGGTGLGLNIVYNLVTLRLKGSVYAASAPTGGARFTVRLSDLSDALTQGAPIPGEKLAD